MSIATGKNSPHGSMWHRWDPHIHSPETVLNDQYVGPDKWEEFLKKIEQSSPCIRSLGVTDYLSLESYEKVLEAKRGGRLPDVDLIFPNVEMRFNVGTKKGSFVNVHLLFNPAESIDEMKRFLSNFIFEYQDIKYRCEKSDLIRFGKAYDSKIQDDTAALRAGTNLFKITPEALKKSGRPTLGLRLIV